MRLFLNIVEIISKTSMCYNRGPHLTISLQRVKATLQPFNKNANYTVQLLLFCVEKIVNHRPKWDVRSQQSHAYWNEEFQQEENERRPSHSDFHSSPVQTQLKVIQLLCWF